MERVRLQLVAFFLACMLGSLAFGQTSGGGGAGSGPAYTRIDLSDFWLDVFEIPYIPGRSSILLGDPLPDGSLPLMVFDDTYALSHQDIVFQGGTLHDFVLYQTNWLGVESFSFINNETPTTYASTSSFS